MKILSKFRTEEDGTRILLDFNKEDIEQLTVIKQTVKVVETSKHGITVYSDKPINNILLPLLNAIINGEVNEI
jgi:hypothetical protein